VGHDHCSKPETDDSSMKITFDLEDRWVHQLEEQLALAPQAQGTIESAAKGYLIMLLRIFALAEEDAEVAMHWRTMFAALKDRREQDQRAN
jgi:hypothetical protein